MIALIGVLALEGALSYVNAYFTQWIGQQAIYDVRVRVFRHVQQQSLSIFDRTPIGALNYATTSDVEALADVLSAGVVVIMGDMVQTVVHSSLYVQFELGTCACNVMCNALYVTCNLMVQAQCTWAVQGNPKAGAQPEFIHAGACYGMQIVQLFGREKWRWIVLRR